MKKPVIAVTPLWDDRLESIWMLPGYLDGLRAAGAGEARGPAGGVPGRGRE